MFGLYENMRFNVAELYGVETRDINKAVKNNLEKFPQGFIFEISEIGKNELVENFHRFDRQKHLFKFKHSIKRENADEIKQLEAKLAELNKALQELKGLNISDS